MLIFALAYWGQKNFVRLLGELKKPKRPFEINLPLEYTFTCMYYMPGLRAIVVVECGPPRGFKKAFPNSSLSYL
jgi:hypothetical protein